VKAELPLVGYCKSRKCAHHHKKQINTDDATDKSWTKRPLGREGSTWQKYSRLLLFDSLKFEKITRYKADTDVIDDDDTFSAFLLCQRLLARGVIFRVLHPAPDRQEQGHKCWLSFIRHPKESVTLLPS
jgi:hypothetical protein